jgi:hypothetical protein
VIPQNLALLLPDWDSLDSVRKAHSVLELWAIWLFAVLVVCDVVAHLIEDTHKPLAKVFERIGLCCFALAVAAELGAYKYGQRNDSLSSQVITSLGTQATNALRDSGTALLQSENAKNVAGDAARNAKRAQDSADGARADARDAQGAAGKAGEDAKQLRSDVDEFELILSAGASGHTLRPVLFSRLKNEPKANISISYFTGAESGTRVFAEKLSQAFKGFGWKVSSGRQDSARSGVTIFNKWADLDVTEPLASDTIPHAGEADWETMQQRLKRELKGISGPDAERLSVLGLALGAQFVQDRSLDANSFRLIIGPGSENPRR